MKKTNLLLVLILLVNAVILWNVCCCNSSCDDNAKCDSTTECSAEKACTAQDSVCTKTTCCKGDKSKCSKGDKSKCCKYGEQKSTCCKKQKCSQKCEKAESKKHARMEMKWMKEELGLTDEQMETLKANKEITKEKVSALKDAHQATLMEMLNDEQKAMFEEMMAKHDKHDHVDQTQENDAAPTEVEE